MAASNSKSAASTAVLLSLNLLLFSMVRSADVATTTCPIDTSQLSVCADLLGLVNVVIGSSETLPCCNLFSGLTDLEAAVCLCAAINADILGIINLDVQLALTLLLNDCGRGWPTGYECTS